jgi:hypothetical protein
MITASFPATILCEENAGDTRTIKGVAVPWNQVGVVADGRKVKFLPSSLPVEARPVVTLGHEGAAIGRVTDNTDTEAGMATSVKVSRVRDGDEALVLAADGVLGMFSVGAEPSSFHYDDDGVMVVAAAEWQHLALLPLGAFTGAVVESVAASTPQGETMSETLAPVVTTEAPPALIEAAGNPGMPAVIPVSAARPITPELTLQRYATLVAQANRGEITADALRSTINAALTNVTTTGIAGIVQPAYRSEINGLIDHGTPLLNSLNRSPLPASGMSIEYPEWVLKPTTGIQSTEKTQITSTGVTFTLKSAPVITIAGGNDISLQSVERSSPSFLESYLRAAAIDWAHQAEAYALTRLTAAAVSATPGANFLANIKALLSGLDPTLTPPGPLTLAVSLDIAIGLVDVTVNNGPAFWNANFSFGNFLPNAAADGLNVVVVPTLDTGKMILFSRQAATWHQQGPADIRVVDVSLLGLDCGIYGYGAMTVEYPKAVVVLDTTP